MSDSIPPERLRRGSDAVYTPVELFSAVSEFACQRASPRPCINQDLVDALAPLREYRFVIYGAQSHEGISYARALSVIIGCPYKIETVEQARALPQIGPKLEIKIAEFLDTGRIKEAIQVQNDPEYKARADLMTVHGVGYAAAADLYRDGFRKPSDLQNVPRYAKTLEYHDDIQIKIPRAEVESVANFIRIQLDKIEPGAHTVLCGGYRRGKAQSNDIDLLITYPHQDGREKFVLRRLVHRLEEKGFIPPDGRLHIQESASFREGPDHKVSSQLDSLDHAFIIFRHPANGTTRHRDYWRRVDLIVCKWDTFGAAVVGWTGGTQFERDLRRWADRRGKWKFDSGGLRDIDGRLIPTMTEKDVFRALGLDYLPPHLRCSDP
ncbi:hypothetical protein OIO90_005259 [Microbotryomycetes sp. JL221]|nr:hypothetical protein OIO90_005259 [Microbotryomycetes sp. JL221]